jgi:inhibitor of KinA sporulation pathway (predicted exonuclease)
MKFFLDFEATQFSNRIISIGCVSENGDTFSTLCQPSNSKDKITDFITQLTGITQEMINVAPTADAAFMNFFIWIIMHGKAEPPEFYCYGGNDREFICSTVKYMTDIVAITFANSILATIKDFSKEIQGSIGLNKLYNFIKAEDNLQKHDALEDAQMLKYVFYNFDKAKDFKKSEICKTSVKNSNLKTKKLAPTLRITNLWIPGTKAYEADTKGTEENYEYKGIGPRGEVLYFDSIDTVISWIMSFGFAPGRKMKNEKDIKDIYYTLIDAINKNEKAYRMKFTRKECDI